MSCEAHIELISAIVDGEAPAEERMSLEKHAAQCENCAKRLESTRALKHAMSRLPGRISPPEAIQARVHALRFRLPRRRRFWTGALVATVGLAGIFALFLGKPNLLNERRERELSDELIADHLKYVPQEMPAEVASDVKSEVESFFQGKVTFAPVVPRLDDSRLLGGRACRIEGRMVQLLFYERNGNKLSLYVSDGATSLDGCRGRDGQQACGSRRGNLSLMLVGDAPDSELRSLLERAAL